MWKAKEFIRYLRRVVLTKAGSANGKRKDNLGDYNGYVECVRTVFDEDETSVKDLMGYFFEVIYPFSWNKQVVEVLPVTNYVQSDPEYQDRLA